MQIDFTLFLQTLVYIVLIILIIIFIVIGIKLIGTLSKVDRLLDDVQKKVDRTDEFFEMIDRFSDYASNVGDKIIGGFLKVVTKLVRKKGNDEDE